MARLNSFYLAPEAWPDNGQAFLRDKEANHLARVLRHKQGDTVRLFDGEGRWGLFTIIEVSRKEVALHALEVHREAAPASSLTLALAWSKSSRRDWLLEKSVELQGNELLFWQAEHSQGKVPAEPKPTWKERTIQAAKQCGATFLPRLTTVSDMDALLTAAKDHDNLLLLWESEQATTLLAPEMLSQGSTLAVIGPEGGLSLAEARAFMDAGFAPVTLGPSILRWETAALHCLSLAFFSRQMDSHGA